MDPEILTRYLRDQVSPSERSQVAAWLQAAPEHEEQLADVAALLALVEADGEALTTAPAPSAASILERAGARAAPPRRSWVRRHAPILAAAAVLVAAVSFYSLRRPEPAFGFTAGDYVTGVAETTTVPLGDGSVLRLGPASRLQVRGSSTERVVTLEGRAYFAVAPLAGRPFQVRTAAGAVTVLGTRFEVRAAADTLSLVVVEGRVALSARDRRITVDAGQMSEIRGGTLSPPAPATDLEHRLAWAGNFLVFQSAPLAEVTREIAERYRVRVEIADSALARRTVTAWLSDRSLEQALTVVCTIVDADCRAAGGTVTMRAR